MQMNVRKMIYLNCGERYEDIDDHRSYIHNLSTRNQEPFVSRAKAAPAKTIRKGYGDENAFYRSRFVFVYLRLRPRSERDCSHSN